MPDIWGENQVRASISIKEATDHGLTDLKWNRRRQHYHVDAFHS